MEMNNHEYQSELSNIEIVTFAIFLLNGESQPIDIEDIAVKALRLIQ